MNRIFLELGYKTIYSDYGLLAKKMMYNFLNCNPLLTGYEDYEYYGGMENVSMNLYPHMLLYQLLDKQYPGSKFILNTREMETWLGRRMEDPGYLTDYLWSSGHSCSQVALMKWKELWRKQHKEATEYFGDRLGRDFLIFDVENEDPRRLYLFLHQNNDVVKERFQELYRRFGNRVDMVTSPTKNILPNTTVYCMYLPSRQESIQKTLSENGFGNVRYFEGVTPKDLTKKDFVEWSTTYLYGPPIHTCHICSHNSWHPTIYEKPSKFCVHYSYLHCLYDAIQNNHPSEYTLIFEDDIFFQGESQDLVKTVEEFMSQDMDVLYLGFGHCKEGYKLKPTPPCEKIIELPRNQSIICKHAILYKNAYIQKMFWKLLPLVDCSDVHFNHVNICEGARVCIPTTPFVFQDRPKFGSFNSNEQEQEIPLF